jgi:hypothetical protein
LVGVIVFVGVGVGVFVFVGVGVGGVYPGGHIVIGNNIPVFGVSQKMSM